MLRKAIVVLAIVLSRNLRVSASAFARSGGRSGGAPGDSFRGAFGGISGGVFGGYGSRIRDHESRDVWGHWGTYYGPMIPAL
jgi:hypothetical protein